MPRMHTYVEWKDESSYPGFFSGSFEIRCYPLWLKWRGLLVRYLASVLSNLREHGGGSDGFNVTSERYALRQVGARLDH